MHDLAVAFANVGKRKLALEWLRKPWRNIS